MADENTENRIAKILERQNELLEEQIAKEQNLSNLRNENLSRLDSELQAAEERLNYETERLKNLVELNKLSEAARKDRADSLNAQKQQLENSLLQLEAGTRAYEKAREKLDTIEKELEVTEEILDLTDEELQILIKQSQEKEKHAKFNKKAVESNKHLVESSKNLLESVTGISDEWTRGSTFTAAMLKSMNDNLTAGKGLGESFRAMAEGAKETLSIQNLAASAILKVTEATKELIFEQDQVIAEFKRATGLGGEYSQSLIDTQVNLKHLGIQTRDVMVAFQGLTAANSTFVYENQATRQALLETTALFEQTYGAGEEFGSTMGTLQTTLGMTADQAETAAFDIAGAAKALGQPPKEMLDDFARLGPQLAAWGPATKKVFLETAAAAKALNLQTSEMLDIAAGFDTFADAADKVGQLNAALGGDYFDTVEMVMATEEDRVEMILDGIEASGRSFAEMGRFERKRLAEAAGMTVEQLGKITNANRDLYNELQQLQKDSTMTYTDLSDAARENMSIEEKLAAIKQSLAQSMRPLIELTLWFLSGVQKVMEFLGPYGGMIVWVTGIVAFFGVKLAVLASQLGLITTAAAPASAGISTVGTATGAAGTAAAPAIPVLLSIAAVFTSIALSAWAVGWAISAIIDSITGLIDTVVKGTSRAKELADLPLITIASNFSDIASSVRDLGEALLELDSTKLSELKDMDLSMTANIEGTRMVKDTLIAANAMTPEAVENVKQVSDHIVRLATETAAAGNSAQLQVIKEIIKEGSPTATAQAPAPAEVVLNVDGTRLGKILMPYVEKSLQVDTRVI